MLSLAFWIGAILFFSIGVAPVAFQVLSSQEAGEIVRRSLRMLHYLGLSCGLLFLLASLLLAPVRRLGVSLVFFMVLLTAISNWLVTPRIERLRASRDIYSEGFSRLHHASTGLEGAVLLMGCIALCRLDRPRSATPGTTGIFRLSSSRDL